MMIRTLPAHVNGQSSEISDDPELNRLDAAALDAMPPSVAEFRVDKVLRLFIRSVTERLVAAGVSAECDRTGGYYIDPINGGIGGIVVSIEQGPRFGRRRPWLLRARVADGVATVTPPASIRRRLRVSEFTQRTQRGMTIVRRPIGFVRSAASVANWIIGDITEPPAAWDEAAAVARDEGVRVYEDVMQFRRSARLAAGGCR